MSGSVLKWEDEQAAKEAISAVRSDKDETDWVVISYQSGQGAGAQVLKCHGKGVGGADSMLECLKDDMVGYCLTRETDMVDESETIKFVFIFWLGEQVPRMQRSRTSIHIGPIKAFFGQFHLDFQATQKSEISNEVVRARVMGTSGSGSSVLDDEGRMMVHQQVEKSGKGKSNRPTTARGSEFQVVDYDHVASQLKQFRAGDGNDWIAFTYKDVKSSNLVFLGSGSGGVEELRDQLRDDNVVYALVRKVHRIDQSDLIRICYIFWIGENVNRMLKARLGTHRGHIYQLLSPYHVDLSVSHAGDLTESVIEDLIASVSGNKSHVLAGSSPHPVPSNASSPSPGARSFPKGGHPMGVGPNVHVNRETVQLQFLDKNAVLKAISDVRSDYSDIDWVLVSYDGLKRAKTLKLVGVGSGGFSEFKNALSDDTVGYGLIRLNEAIDESITVKFVFVNWIGEHVDRMQRAYLSTHKGFIVELFSPFHVDHECGNKDEITEDILVSKIKRASGTANYTLN